MVLMPFEKRAVIHPKRHVFKYPDGKTHTGRLKKTQQIYANRRNIRLRLLQKCRMPMQFKA